MKFLNRNKQNKETKQEGVTSEYNASTSNTTNDGTSAPIDDKKSKMKNNLDSKKKFINEKLEVLKAQDETKITKFMTVILGTGAALAIAYMFFPSSLFMKDKADSIEVKANATAIVPIHAVKGESWADFRKKIERDGLNDKYFPATSAYLKANCNIVQSPENLEKYQRTYNLLKRIDYMAKLPEFQLLSSCRSLRGDNEVVKIFSPYVYDKYQHKDDVWIELDKLVKQMKRTRYSINMEIEKRIKNKEIHGIFYDEKTGKYTTIDKNKATLYEENRDKEVWLSLIRSQWEVDSKIFEYTGRFYDEMVKGEVIEIPDFMKDEETILILKQIENARKSKKDNSIETHQK